MGAAMTTSDQDLPVVRLPHQFDGLSLSQVAANVVKISPDGLPRVIAFDFSKLAFVRPAGVVFLSNLPHWLHEKGTRVEFRNVTRPSAALAFLDDSLFFQQHCGEKIRPTAAPRSTTRPLIRIAHKDSHAWLEGDLLRGCPISFP
jgi:hypothetical protein